jgi:hypothetical protein
MSEEVGQLTIVVKYEGVVHSLKQALFGERMGG